VEADAALNVVGTAKSHAPPILQVRDLHKSFRSLAVLKGVSFELWRGDVMSVIGASGSGKSTMLRCINYLETPSAGDIYLEGMPVGCRVDQAGRRHRATAAELNRTRQNIGMVFQQFNLWPHRTVLENVVEAPIHVLRQPKSEARERAESLLRKVGLIEKRDEYPARLSGGQQQRVAIARALAMNPKIMLFDEPTSSLDPEITIEVLDVMKTLVDEGMTMMVVTHEIGFAREASNRVMFLHDGKIEEEGPPEQVLSSPNSARCRMFLSRIL
jgi:ABC-type histidine transport system ATPase subunit